jgi:hypothetical protein
MRFNLSGSISSGHRAIGAELERMVIIEDLLMEVVSIVIQYPLNPLYPVVKDEFQFRRLDFAQTFLPVPLSCTRKTKNQKVPSQDCETNGVLKS